MTYGRNSNLYYFLFRARIQFFSTPLSLNLPQIVWNQAKTTIMSCLIGKVSWNENVKFMAWVCLITERRKLTGWFIMQCIKKGSTLRISPKKEKSSSRVVYRHGKQHKEIRDFLHCHKRINNILRKMLIDYAQNAHARFLRFLP